MIKFMILFGPPEETERFENVYQDFLALVERMPNILRRQVVHVTGSPQGAPAIYRILELYFESIQTQTEALMSDAGQEAGQELHRLPTDSFQLLFTDVYEEAGGSTSEPAADEESVAADEESVAADEEAAAESETVSDTVSPSGAD
ncbi:MAG: EthD family reductase [Chloroflexi bacterium]|nr:EthD family reductase [Chloroflexota bacterium]